VPVEEIKANGYDLSINRYKEVVYEEIKYSSPQQIIDSDGTELGLKQLTEERLKLLDQLQRML
jgi:type I restriction enzyme M protein